MRLSLRARLLGATVAVVAAGLTAASVATYSALRAFLYQRIDNQLEAAHVTVERLRPRSSAPGALRQLEVALPGAFVEIRDPSGRTVASVPARLRDGSPTRPRLPDPLAKALAPGPGARTMTVPSLEPGGPEHRVRVERRRGGAFIAVGLTLDETALTLRRLVVVEALVTAGVVVAAAGLGSMLVQLGLRPLARMEQTAASISAGQLHRRVDDDDERTEVGRLGRALNVMLERIDAAFAQRRASEEAARAAEQRTRRFVADASHELRTPVAAVRAYAELYRRGADRHPDDLARLLARIESEAARMGVLVDDLLLLTRLDEGRQLERAHVDLGALAADAVAAAGALEPDRPLALAVEGSLEVFGDRDRLRQVIDNLLGNVRTHTPPGAPADVAVRAEAGSAVLEVADRGPGVTPADAPLVFERFYRADAGRSRAHGGAGLGLAIVQAIVRAHGGTVGVRQRDGGGAVFRVELPLAEQRFGTVEPDPAPAPS